MSIVSPVEPKKAIRVLHGFIGLQPCLSLENGAGATRSGCGKIFSLISKVCSIARQAGGLSGMPWNLPPPGP